MILELTKDQAENIATMIFEFCKSIDNKKDKNGNYKNKCWGDCLITRDEILHKLRNDDEV